MIGKQGRQYFQKCIDLVIDENIEGDFVQCGVWRGGLAAYTLYTFTENNISKKLYLYDTFEGMIPPTEIDGDKAISSFELHESWCYSPIDEVKKNLSEANINYANTCNLIKGKVEDTLKNVNNLPDKICMLHLDTDWYESTKIELEILFPLLSYNGILMIDDYKNKKDIDRGWDGCTYAVDEFFKNNKNNFKIQKIENMYHDKILIAKKIEC